MTPELKAKWVAALRTGKYQQGRGMLKSGAAYCCLGVLCRVAGLSISRDGRRVTKHGRRLDYGPLEKIVGEDATKTLFRMNDSGGRSFPEIADWIEVNL